MRIGELSTVTGVSTKALRFYEDHGLIPAPARTTGGYRDYTPQTADRIRFIRRGQAAGLTLAQIRDILARRDAGTLPCKHVRDLLGAHLDALDEKIAELTALRHTVAQLHQREITPSDCDPASVCRYL